MSDSREVTLYHWPHSRSAGTLVLLEELGAPYKLEIIDITKGVQREPTFLAINPMGKLPTIRVGAAVVTEQVAIYTYLADLFPEAGLAPALSDPLRGPYLRWLVFYAACFEPAMGDIAGKRDPGPAMSSPYGSADAVLGTLLGQLRQGPYMLGERFTAVDVLWGSALGFMTAFKLVPEAPEVMAYLARVGGRPASARADAVNAKIMAGTSGAA
ncbi:glutathione S-transferase family protein [Chelatococcus reniformis]|uniref:Glutathione S-transferase n=1 Tax=Chelatococcus reniformis TaxID=1494448 RepID=A0A916U8P9_9HYPH|nr:glutathione S-transferase family protein [Chelatococcus reniformis]GGC63273.1 glutathione S-transferase [Chelatococcus reniformis]